MVPTRQLLLRGGMRALQLGSVVAVVVTLTFALVHLVPGDPALTILGVRATPESLAALRAQLGTDQPVLTQFVVYLGDLAHGDLGMSITQRGRSVLEIIVPALSVTGSVVMVTVLFSLVVGVAVGLLAGLTPLRMVDTGVRLMIVTLLAMPPFFVGLVLILVVALTAGVAPAGGWGAGWPENFRFVWLPSLALTAYLAPIIARTVRQSTREIAEEQFVESAVVRGLPFHVVVLRHVLPNTLLPVVTIVGFNIASLVGGAVVIEAVFGLPGLGTALVTAVGSRDYPVVQGIALVTAVLVVVVNALTELLYVVVDPRAHAAA